MARITVGQPFLAVLFVLLLAAPLSTAQSQESAPPIRVTVNRVNVGVTVTDTAGHFIEGLRREDFQLFDNGVEQPITDFLPIEGPGAVGDGDADVDAVDGDADGRGLLRLSPGQRGCAEQRKQDSQDWLSHSRADSQK